MKQHVFGSNRVKAAVRAGLTMLTLALPSWPVSAQEQDTDQSENKPLVLRKVDLQDLLNGTEMDFESALSVYNQAMLRDRSVTPFLQQLEGYAGDSSKSARYRSNAWLVGAHAYWNYGSIGKALEWIDKAIQTDLNGSTLLMKAQLLEANGSMDEARQCYEQVMPLLKDVQAKEKVQLRLTFMDVGQKNIQSLVKLAQTHDTAFRNRAAVALAILGHYNEASSLYVIEQKGDGSQSYREHLRLGQWALRAGNIDKAQEHAWQAVQVATLGRDRLYALSVAVDAYEMNNGLDKLLQRFAAKGVLTEEENNCRVDILRRLKRYDEAIKLFLAANNLQLSAEAQTQLLRMYRDGDRSREMIAEYNKLIARDRHQPKWVEGLSQYLMERGDEPAARKAWQDFIDRNTEAKYLLAGAEGMERFGFYELATQASDKSRKLGEDAAFEALMFRFDLNLRQGKSLEAQQALDELKKILPPASRKRLDIADSYERLSKSRECLQTMLDLDKQLEGGLGVDDKMRMAWLYDETGQRKAALDLWRSMWNSGVEPARRRVIEDRMMRLAVETGRIGEVALDLEEKIDKGTAADRDVALLIRIYTEANDAVGAVEVIRNNFQKKNGKDSVESLREQARVYRVMGRYDAFDKVTTHLVEIDPERRTDHLQALLMNLLENSDLQVAQGDSLELKFRKPVLEKFNKLMAQMREAVGSEVADAQFEAGMMQLGGMWTKALEVYRVALAKNPGQGDTYLLMADILAKDAYLQGVREAAVVGSKGGSWTEQDKARERWKEPEAQAISMLQYALEGAQRDDAFIVAVDGILNMQPKDGAILRWTQRRILERLTGRADKLYLYELLGELAEWQKDSETYLSALENSLAYANSRRSNILRELCMATSQPSVADNGRFKAPDLKRNLEYSRRLVALGERMPPDVYLGMGKTALQLGEMRLATYAFNLALDCTDTRSLHEDIGDLYRSAGYNVEATDEYDKALLIDVSNIGLMLKLASLRNADNFSERANNLYLQALRIIVNRQALDNESDAQIPRLREVLTREYRDFYWPAVTGFLRTLPRDFTEGGKAAQQFAALEDLYDQTLAQTKIEKGKSLFHYPRLSVAARLVHVVGMRAGNYELADRFAENLVRQFGYDEALVKDFLQERLSLGRRAAAEKLLDQARQASLLVARKYESLVEVKSQNSLELMTVSPALLDDAMERKQYALARTVALQNKDYDRLYSIYEILIDGLSGNHLFGTLDGVRQVLDPKRYEVLRKRLLDKIAQQPDFAKKLLFGADDSIARQMGKRESALLDFEKEQGRELLSAQQIVEMSTGFASGKRGEDWTKQRMNFDMPYAASKLNTEQKIALLARYLQSAPLGSGNGGNARSKVQWHDVLYLLGSMLTKPLSTEASSQISASIKNTVRTVMTDDAVRLDGKESEDIRRIAEIWHYRFTRGMDKANAPMLESLEEELVRTYPKKLHPGLLKASVMLDTGREDEGLGLLMDNILRSEKRHVAADPFEAMKGARNYLDDSIQYVVRRYGVADQKSFAKFLAVTERKESKDGPSGALLALQRTLFRESGAGDIKMIQWLEEKSKRYPTSELLINELRCVHGDRGNVGEEIGALERLVEMQPKNPAYRWRLFKLWQQFDNPERALASTAGRLSDVLSSDRVIAATEAAYGERTSETSLSDPALQRVKQLTAAKESNNATAAQMGLRGLLQMLPPMRPVNDIDVSRPYASSDQQDPYQVGYRSLVNIDWGVAAAGAEPDKTSVIEPLISYIQRGSLVGGADRSGKLLDNTAKYSFSIPEFESIIQAFVPADIDPKYLVYQLLVDAYVQDHRADSEFARLRQLVDAGSADNKSFVMYLDLALRQSKVSLPDILPGVEKQLLASGRVSSKYQTLLLARLYAKAGHADKALSLYNTAALMVFTVNSMMGDHAGLESAGTPFFATALGLFTEARKYLGPQDLNRFTDQMLSVAKLQLSPEGRDRIFDLNTYAELVTSVLKADQTLPSALAAFQDVLTADAAESALMPQQLAEAAYVQALLGQPGPALKSMEKAFAKTRQDSTFIYGGYETIFGGRVGLPERVHGWTLGPNNFLVLAERAFPLTSTESPQTKVLKWSEDLVAALPGWLERGALDRDKAVQLLSLITVRLHGGGHIQQASVAAQSFEGLLSQPQEVSLPTGTLAVHAMNTAGTFASPKTLMDVVRQKRIYPKYLAPVLGQIAKTEGAAKARELGELAAGYTQQQDLLKQLQSLSLEAGDATRAQHWAEAVRRAEQAKISIDKGEDVGTKGLEVAAVK